MSQQAVRSLEPRAEFPARGQDEDTAGEKSESDWGLAPEKKGLTRENKFILFVLLVLVGVFGFVVFRNFQKKQGGKKADEVAAKSTKAAKTPEKSQPVKQQTPAKVPSLVENSSTDDFAEPSRSNASDTPRQSQLPQDQFVGQDEFVGDDLNAADDLNGDPPSQLSALDQAPAQDAFLDTEAPSELAQPEVSGMNQELPAQDSFDALGSADTTLPATDSFAAGPTDDFADAPVQDLMTDTVPRTTSPGTSPRGTSPRGTNPRTTPRTAHRTGLPTESVDTETPIEFEVPPMETVAFEEPLEGSAEGGDASFTQAGGTSAEPIGKRDSSSVGTETFSDQTVPQDFQNQESVTGIDSAYEAPLGGETDPMAAPLTETVPRAATVPRTSTEHRTATTPRTSPTVPRTATRPRSTALPPPPLDPTDERLGGYREGDIYSTGSGAGMPPAVGSPVKQTSGREPLVANIGEYIVRPNDNYWRISRKVYGTARYFAALAKHNEAQVPDPRHMRPGIKISTPSQDLLERDYRVLLPIVSPSRAVGSVDPNAPKNGYFVDSSGQPAYRIGAHDTLSSISQKTLGRSTRWDEIFELNRDRLEGADSLTIGSVLKLPADASQTRMVGRPVENR